MSEAEEVGKTHS